MAVFRTGRERTITLSGSTAGDAYNNNIYISVVPLEVFAKAPSAQVSALGVSIVFETNVFGPAGKGPLRTYVGERVTITLPLNMGSAQGEDLREYVAPLPYTGSMAGTWQIQATVEECVEITEDTVTTGEQLPAPTKYRFFERLKPQTTLSVSANCGGASAAIAAQVPSGGMEVMVSSVAAQVTARAQNDGGSLYESTASVTFSLPTAPTNPSYLRTLAQSGGRYYEAQVTDSAVAALARLTSGHSANQATSEVSGTLYAAKVGNCAFRVASVDADYPTTLYVKLREKKHTWTNVQVTNGVASRSIEQKRWTCSSSFDGNTHMDAVDEWESVRAYLDANSLSAIGEDSESTRLYGHGWRFVALAIDHATRTVIDTCESLLNTEREWVAVQQCVLSAAAGVITVTPTGASPIVRRTMLSPTPERWNCYAFLRMRLRSSLTDAPVTLVVGGKRFTRNTGVAANTWTDLYFDLCAPTNSTQSVDQQTSVYPEGRADGEYWGVTACSELRIELANGTYDIDEISLDVYPWESRTPPYNVPNHSICVIPSRGWWIEREPGHVVRRLITGQSDGKQALEIEDAAVVNGAPVQRTIEWVYHEIVRVDNGIARWRGWSCTLLAPSTSGCTGSYNPIWNCYLNKNAPATWLCGAGLTYDGAAWTPWGNRIALPATLPAQSLYDEVDWYPGIGDVWAWGNASYGGALVIAFGAVLRSRAFGIILDQQKRRFTAGGVELLRLANQDSGGNAGLDAWKGYYETGAPYALGMEDYKLVGTGAATGVVPSTREYYTRLPLRTVAVIAPVRDWHSLECDSPRSYLLLASPGRMEIYHQATADLLAEDESWDNLKPLLVRYDSRWDGTLTVWSAYQENGTVKVVRSWDRLQKYAEVLTLTARTAVLETISARGIIVLLWENNGNVQVQYSYDAGQTWTTAQNALLNGSPFTGELLDSDYDPRWDAIYLVRKSGTTVQVLVSYDLGATWSLLVS